MTQNALGKFLAEYPTELATQQIELEIANWTQAYKEKLVPLNESLETALKIQDIIRANPHLANNRNSIFFNFQKEFSNMQLFIKQENDKATLRIQQAGKDGDYSSLDMKTWEVYHSHIGVEAERKILQNAFLNNITTHEDYKIINEAYQNLVDTPMAYDEFIKIK